MGIRGNSAVGVDALTAATGGDEEAFRRTIEPHWSGLHAHCYRLLGSTYDADDALQDTLLRAWRNLAGFDRSRPLRPWLYKIATNAALDLLSHRSRRYLPFDARVSASSGDPEQLPESSWISPYPDEVLNLPSGYASPDASYEQREAVELAFVAALQHLPARQRAILVLRDVLGFSIAEIAENLEITETSVNSALQRARQTMGHLLPERSQTHTLRGLGDPHVRALAQRFVDAFESGDVESVIELLDDDPSFAMPPYAQWYRGRSAVASSWLMPPSQPGLLKLIPISASGQLAFGAYRIHLGGEAYFPLCIDVLALNGPRIGCVVAFRNTGAFELFNLPPKLSPA